MKRRPVKGIERSTNSMRIAVIDYGSGNIRSVAKALERVGAEVEVLDSAFDLSRFDKFVLPGVGAFGDTVDGLRSRGLWDVVVEIIKNDLPYLGICLGMQILCRGSEESPGYQGLGLFDVEVRRFSPDKEHKVPQMGWNQVNHNQDPLFSGIPLGGYFYFCHSYYVPLKVGAEFVISKTDYTLTYASGLRKGNVIGVQFHPEKSQTLGLKLLENFVRA